MFETFYISGFFYNETLYKENAFTVDDLFDKTPGVDFNATKVEFKTTRTMFFGACFTLSFPNEVSFMQTSSFVIKRSWDMLVYFHNEGEEFWINLL